MWVYSSQGVNVFQLGAWLFKHETALPHTIIWRPSVPQLCCSGTHRINTRSNVTVPDVRYSITGVNCVSTWVLDYVAWDCSRSHNSFGDHPSSSCACSGTHRINTRSNVPTVPDVSVFHHNESIVLRMGCLMYVSMTLLSPHNSFGDHRVPQLCCLCTSQNHTRSNVTVRDVSVFIKGVNCVSIGCLICKHETALPSHNHLETSSSHCAVSALTECNTLVVTVRWCECNSITRSQLCFNWVLDWCKMTALPSDNLWKIVPMIVLLWHSHSIMSSTPIETQLTPCDGITSTSVQWHYTCIVVSQQTWGQCSWCVRESSLMAYIIKTTQLETQLTPCDGNHISIRYMWTLLRVLILWVPEQHNWGTDGPPNELCGGEQSHAYIIIAPNLNTIDSCAGYTHIRYSDITTCIDSVSARAAQLEDGWVSKWMLWGRDSLMLIIAPNWNTIDSLWWNTLNQVLSDILRVFDSVIVAKAQLGTVCLFNELCEGEPVSCLT